jgi:hypothetical protein
LREAGEAAFDAVVEGGIDLADLADHSLEDLLRRDGLAYFLLALCTQTVEARVPGLAELFADVLDERQVVGVGVRVRIFALLREIDQTGVVLREQLVDDGLDVGLDFLGEAAATFSSEWLSCSERLFLLCVSL